MPRTMPAVVKTRPQTGAELREIPLPRLQPGEVLIKVRATSVCGTDMHIYHWDAWSQGRIGAAKLPQTMGHEVAGMVVDVSPGVVRVQPGDYVSVETHIPCKRCIQCLTGQEHLCDHLEIVGVDRDGAFAEYIAVPESVCWLNDPAIPPEVAALQEPLGNATYAVLGEDCDVAGRNLAIIGDGPVALLSVGVARCAGACRIFLFGMNDFNLGIGRAMGADHCIDVTKDDGHRYDYVKDHTYGFGVDIVVDMAGTAGALKDGFKILRKGGRFSAFGISPETPTALDYNDGIVFKGARIHGINGRKMFDTWFRVRNFLATGRLDVTPVITNVFPLESFAEGMEAMAAVPRTSAKVVLFPDAKELELARERRGEKEVSEFTSVNC